jgi:hypothetical protein
MRIEDVSHEAHAHRILVRLRYLIVAFSFIGLYLRFVDDIYICILPPSAIHENINDFVWSQFTILILK